MADPWDGIIPQETLDHYRNAGFGRESRLGENAALLVIDVQYSTSGEHPMPLGEAVSYHPLNCGEFAWDAIGRMVPLIAAFREADAPLIYAHSAPRQLRGKKSRWPVMDTNSRFFEIVEEVAPREGDILLPKTSPSVFFGTPILKYLNTLKVDTLFMVGNTTSGCIRASVVDAVSYDYNVVVAHDACYDRAPICHAVNLFDIASKYADVLSTDAAIARLAEMSAQ